MTAGFWQMRPESRGHVRARSADPRQPPAIQPNYLAAEEDRRAAVAGMRWCRRLLGTRALAAYSEREILPGPEAESDEELLAHVRRAGATVCHAIGTYRRGQDPLAVVGRVPAPARPGRPPRRRRLGDADHAVGQTSAATLMIGEKASDLILGDRR